MAALLGISILLCGPAAHSAQAAATVFLEDLTWTELREQILAGHTTILIPIGGTEQNGPHMALGKHNARARILAERIARTLGNALVAPVIAYVPEGNVEPPTAHMRFPGTITVPDDIFERTLESAARSFRRHGFRDIVFLGDHGGYQRDLRVAADRLNREWAQVPTRAHALPEYYQSTEEPYASLLKGRGFRDEEIGTHAALADTSLTLALAPAMVRSERLASGALMGKADGVYGDPRRASADLGQLGVDLIVAKTVEAIRKATAKR